MSRYSSFLVCILFTIVSHAQAPEDIVGEFRSINAALTNTDCSSGKGSLISNRAMNIFLSNKAGTYLSGDDDLSLYKNSITFNTTTGVFSVLHNLRQAKGTDEPVRSFGMVGAKANIVNGFSAIFNNKHAVNDFGLIIKKVWMGKTTTRFDNCTPAQSSSMGQKQLMDAQRYSMLNLVEKETKEQEMDFKNSLSAMDTTAITAGAKTVLRNNFYAALKEAQSRRFAELQSAALIATSGYKLITTSWTGIGAYMPVIIQKFYVASSFAGNFSEEHLYPFEIYLSHTRLLESSRAGRLFFKTNAKLFSNNTYHSKGLERLAISEYKLRGGIDTTGLFRQNSGEVLIGLYQRFFTPALNATVVYIPRASHAGISLFLEQNFGRYKVLNAKIGVPVVLIDKKGDPAINFEFQVRFFDLSHEVQPGIKLGDKTSVGFSIGVPFSKIVY